MPVLTRCDTREVCSQSIFMTGFMRVSHPIGSHFYSLNKKLWFPFPCRSPLYRCSFLISLTCYYRRHISWGNTRRCCNQFHVRVASIQRQVSFLQWFAAKSHISDNYFYIIFAQLGSTGVKNETFSSRKVRCHYNFDCCLYKRKLDSVE